MSWKPHRELAIPALTLPNRFSTIAASFENPVGEVFHGHPSSRIDIRVWKNRTRGVLQDYAGNGLRHRRRGWLWHEHFYGLRTTMVL